MHMLQSLFYLTIALHVSGIIITHLQEHKTAVTVFLISNFRRVLHVVYFLLGNSPASEFYMPTFRNTLSVPSS